MTFLFQQAVNGIALGGVLALFALGFSLVVANMKVFHVAHAGVFTVGGLLVWHLIDGLGLPFLIALPLTALGTGALNVLVYFVAIRRLEHRPDREMGAFVCSLGALMVLNQLVDIDLDHATVRLPFDTFPERAWAVGGVQVSSIQLLMVGLSLVLFLVLRWLLDSTQIGREIRATAFNREVAAMLGTRTDVVTAVVFAVSGALAGVGAVLVAISFNQVNSQLGASYLVLALAVMVIGGFGSVGGTVVAGLGLGVISSFTTGYVTSSFKDVVVFALLLLFLILRPAGLFKVAEDGLRP